MNAAQLRGHLTRLSLDVAKLRNDADREWRASGDDRHLVLWVRLKHAAEQLDEANRIVGEAFASSLVAAHLPGLTDSDRAQADEAGRRA